jgi:hypothetical protein
MRLICALILSALFVGCQSTPRPPRVVKFDSEPQGARVFVGMGPNEGDAKKARNYLGMTPLEWTVPEEMIDDDIYFRAPGALVYSMVVPPAVVFYAEPPASGTNLFPQTQVFHSGTTFTPADRIPLGVFFDLTKPKP